MRCPGPGRQRVRADGFGNQSDQRADAQQHRKRHTQRPQPGKKTGPVHPASITVGSAGFVTPPRNSSNKGSIATKLQAISA